MSLRDAERTDYRYHFSFLTTVLATVLTADIEPLFCYRFKGLPVCRGFWANGYRKSYNFSFSLTHCFIKFFSQDIFK